MTIARRISNTLPRGAGLAILSLCLAVGCADSGAGTVDGGVESGPTLDAEADATPAPDAPSDLGIDSSSAPDLDAEIDAEIDSGPDAAPVPDADLGAEIEPEPEIEPDLEIQPEIEPDAEIEPELEIAAGPDADQDADTEPGPDIASPPDPLAVFGNRYWNVYRPAFLASYFVDGRVTDRIAGGVPMFGDNTVFMAKALSTFVYEYRAAGLDDSLLRIHQILDAYAELDALPANPALGYLFTDPLDGYVYRSDRGPDYTSNFCGPFAETLCWPDSATRDNEPSGDQMLAQLRALWDVVHVPGALIHDGVDLKELARAHADRLGGYLRDQHWVIRDIFGKEVKRGPDQRWISWGFQRGAAHVTGKPKSDYESTWSVSVATVKPADQKAFAILFIQGALKFTEACKSGAAVDFSALLGFPFVWNIDCNEFNIGLAGDAAVISLDQDPASPDWFSAVVDRKALISQGHAVYAMYARYLFNDDDPSLLAAAARFLDAPATPPTGDNLDPNGWCRSWRWGHDFDTPNTCADSPHLFETYSGIDYMLPRAMASAFGEFPE